LLIFLTKIHLSVELRAIAGVVVCIVSTGRYGLMNPACIETSSVVAALKEGDLHSANDSLLLPLIELLYLTITTGPAPPSCPCAVVVEEERPDVVRVLLLESDSVGIPLLGESGVSVPEGGRRLQPFIELDALSGPVVPDLLGRLVQDELQDC
jgi:hypothetical protein